MKVFIIGGTGLLGSECAAEFIRRGHDVCAVALPQIPAGAVLPAEMKITYGNYLTMTEEEMLSAMAGMDILVFAAGVDERVEFPAPVMDYYIKYNVAPVDRIMKLARQCGIKKAVVLGSYFSWFAKKWPEKHLAEKHPYIKSRLMQEKTALKYNSDGFSVMVMELPYIFGVQPGRKPVWTFLVKSIMKMPFATFYTKGGTTMVTTRQVAQAVVGAAVQGTGGKCYPVGWYNMTWKELLSIFHKYMGCPERMIITIPSFLYKLYGWFTMRDFKHRGIDSGLDMCAFSDIQTSYTYIDKTEMKNELGVKDDDIDAAIGDSVRLCLSAIKGGKTLMEMKAE